MIQKRNLKRSLNLSGRTPYSGGAFCSYFQYNDTQGIKVLFTDGYTRIKSLRKSMVWRHATLENSYLRKCGARVDNIPKAYGVYPIKIGRKYYPGIVMQHINGHTLKQARGLTVEQKYELRDKLSIALQKKNIRHHDLHLSNIIVCSDSKKYYVIDFTVGLITLDGICRDDGRQY